METINNKPGRYGKIDFEEEKLVDLPEFTKNDVENTQESKEFDCKTKLFTSINQNKEQKNQVKECFQNDLKFKKRKEIIFQSISDSGHDCFMKDSAFEEKVNSGLKGKNIQFYGLFRN